MFIEPIWDLYRVEYSKNAIFKQLDRPRMGDYQGTPTGEETNKATYLEQTTDPRWCFLST
jgi:hypothetical protein